MRTVVLYGEMGAMFGKVRHLDVASPAEAVRALINMVPGFRQYLQDHYESPFRVLVNEEAQDFDALHHPVGRSEVIKIVPVVAGANGGLGSILTGALLIGLTIATGGTAALWGAGMFTATAGNWMASMAIGMGMSMIIGGVAGLLANTPKENFTNTSSDSPTFSFGTPTLTVGQGGGVPLGYGEMIIGGVVISAGIDAQTWQDKGFGNAAPDNAGTRGGDGDTSPWVWAIEPTA